MAVRAALQLRWTFALGPSSWAPVPYGRIVAALSRAFGPVTPAKLTDAEARALVEQRRTGAPVVPFISAEPRAVRRRAGIVLMVLVALSAFASLVFQR